MPIIKYPISLNEDEQNQLKFMAKKLGFVEHNKFYGAYSQTIKFSINSLYEILLQIEMFIPDLPESKLDLLFSAIKKIKMEKYKIEKEIKAKNMGEIV